jgi:hypothetical protein
LVHAYWNRGGPKRFFQAYQKVFLVPELRDVYKDFFFRKALSFLNAENRINNAKLPIDPEPKTQLERLNSEANGP